jgi:hypothetical protein
LKLGRQKKENRRHRARENRMEMEEIGQKRKVEKGR